MPRRAWLRLTPRTLTERETCRNAAAKQGSQSAAAARIVTPHGAEYGSSHMGVPGRPQPATMVPNNHSKRSASTTGRRPRQKKHNAPPSRRRRAPPLPVTLLPCSRRAKSGCSVRATRRGRRQQRHTHVLLHRLRVPAQSHGIEQQQWSAAMPVYLRPTAPPPHQSACVAYRPSQPQQPRGRHQLHTPSASAQIDITRMTPVRLVMSSTRQRWIDRAPAPCMDTLGS